MLAKIKADLAAAKAKVVAAWAYVSAHYKQLVAAAVAGKYSAAIIATVSALIHKL